MKRFMLVVSIGWSIACSIGWSIGCGASAATPPVLEAPVGIPAGIPAGIPVGIATRESTASQVAVPLPAGFYFREDARSSTCFDCPTPTAVVVMDFDAQAPAVERSLALGYPRIGYVAGRQVAILGLFETEVDAHRWRGTDESMRVERIAPPELIPNTSEMRSDEPRPMLWVQSLPTTPVHAYGEREVSRWLDNGELSGAACTLPPNTIWQVSERALSHAEMNLLSVPFTCPNGDAAFVRKQDTVRHSTFRRTSDGFEKLQLLYAECGDVGYLRVRYDTEGTELDREEFAMGPGCGAENDIAARAQQACPGGTVQSCVSRGHAHLDSDPRRGFQLLERACDFGHHGACRGVAEFVAELGGRDAMRQAIYRVSHHCSTGDNESCRVIESVLQGAAERSDRPGLAEACELREHDDRMASISSDACALLATL